MHVCNSLISYSENYLENVGKGRGFFAITKLQQNYKGRELEQINHDKVKGTES